MKPNKILRAFLMLAVCLGVMTRTVFAAARLQIWDPAISSLSGIMFPLLPVRLHSLEWKLSALPRSTVSPVRQGSIPSSPLKERSARPGNMSPHGARMFPPHLFPISRIILTESVAPTTG